MPTYTLTHLTGTNDHRAAMATLYDGASAGDTVVVPTNATDFTFASPADPGDGTAYYSIVPKTGTAGNILTTTINGDIIAAGSSYAGLRASIIGCDAKSYQAFGGSGSVSGSAMPDVGAEQGRHIMQLRACDHITLDGSGGLAFSAAAGGDCLLISGNEDVDAQDNLASSDITVSDVTFSGAKRNNVSITGASDVTFNRCTWSDAAGTPPQSGIDIEPEDFADDQATRILINECVGHGNASRDFLMSTESMVGTAPPVSVTFRNCLSRRGTISADRGFEVQDDVAKANTGTITFDCCRAERLDGPAMWFEMNISNSVQVVVTGGSSRYCARTASREPINFVLTGAATGLGVHFQNYAVYDHLVREATSVTSENTATNVTGNIRRQSRQWPHNGARDALLPNLKIGRFGRLQFSNSARSRRSALRGER